MRNILCTTCIALWQQASSLNKPALWQYWETGSWDSGLNFDSWVDQMFEPQHGLQQSNKQNTSALQRPKWLPLRTDDFPAAPTSRPCQRW